MKLPVVPSGEKTVSTSVLSCPEMTRLDLAFGVFQGIASVVMVSSAFALACLGTESVSASEGMPLAGTSVSSQEMAGASACLGRRPLDCSVEMLALVCASEACQVMMLLGNASEGRTPYAWEMQPHKASHQEWGQTWEKAPCKWGCMSFVGCHMHHTDGRHHSQHKET